MNLPKTFRGLKDIFIKADPPGPSELEGEYLVDMLTIFPSFKRFSHRKVFHKENEMMQGYNVLFGKKWGYFFLEEDMCTALNQKAATVINYNRKGNSPIIRGIRDQIRCVNKQELYIGRFNYMLSGRLIFLGYFSLERM
jgi:hypothetical protein